MMNKVPDFTENDARDYEEYMGEGQPEEEYDDEDAILADQDKRAEKTKIYRVKYPSREE